jgi:RHS repeat-associated protein
MMNEGMMGFSSMPQTHGVVFYPLRPFVPGGPTRWLTRDPIGERGGLNLYGFVSNNPVSYVDPYGLFVPAPAAAVMAAMLEGAGGATATAGGLGAGTIGGVVVGVPVVFGGVGVVLFAMANTAPSPVLYPNGAVNNPIPSSVTMPVGTVLGPGEYRDQDGNIRNVAGDIVRDKSGRSVAQDGGCPQKARSVLDHIKANGSPSPGYMGGRTFLNDGRGGGQILPATDPSGNPIAYQEFDVNPYQQGVNRGPERIVIGSDGKAYYTDDHYSTFTEIK